MWSGLLENDKKMVKFKMLFLDGTGEQKLSCSDFVRDYF